MQFVTLVRLRPEIAGALPTTREPGLYEMEWSRLSKQIQLVGGRITTMLNILGNDYDLMIIGEAEDPKVISRIDALCKHEGFIAKNHVAVAADEYARLVHEVHRIIHPDDRLPQSREVAGSEDEEERQA